MNPACINEDFSCDEQLELMGQGLDHYFPNDPRKVHRIWIQHKKYMALQRDGDLFYEDGKKKNTCNLEGPDHGCSGADWWHDLPRPIDSVLADLREFAMRFLAQKGQE